MVARGRIEFFLVEYNINAWGGNTLALDKLKLSNLATNILFLLVFHVTIFKIDALVPLGTEQV